MSNSHRTCQGEPGASSLQLLPITSISWIIVFISFQILLAWECSNSCSARFHQRWTSSWQKRLLEVVLSFIFFWFCSQSSDFKWGLSLKDSYKNDKLALLLCVAFCLTVSALTCSCHQLQRTLFPLQETPNAPLPTVQETPNAPFPSVQGSRQSTSGCVRSPVPLWCLVSHKCWTDWQCHYNMLCYSQFYWGFIKCYGEKPFPC